MSALCYKVKNDIKKQYRANLQTAEWIWIFASPDDKVYEKKKIIISITVVKSHTV